jgi:hypothetical protein
LVALEGSDSAARLAAIRDLARMGSAAREAVPALVRTLDDSDARAAAEAARALGEIRDRSAAAPLLSVLDRTVGETPTTLGLSAVRALARLGSRRSQPVLDGLLRAAQNASDPAVRTEAAAALGAIGSDAPGAAAVALASVAEQDADEGVRKAAAAAADKLDPSARRWLAAAPVVKRGHEALLARRLVAPREDCALALALKALEINPQGADARSLHEQSVAAIGAEVRAAAKADPSKAERLLEEAAAIEPGLAGLEQLRSVVAQAKQDEHRRTHVFRLLHKHSSRSVLGGAIRIGDGKTSGCRGVLEILEDGFRFDTQETFDTRQDHIEFRSAQIKSIQMRDNGEMLRIDTDGGKYDFYGQAADLQRVRAALAK